MTTNLRKIFIVGGGSNYINWMIGNEVDTISDSDFVVFTGGEDVSPELYGAEKHPDTQNNWKRDQEEVAAFRIAKALKKPVVGICRGAQFLCVMAKGELIQHQENPKYFHGMHTYDERNLMVTSTHHQAQWPWCLDKDEFRILGWSKGVSRFHEGGTKEEMVLGVVPGEVEVEVCHYPKIKALAIQPHPEMMYHQRHLNAESGAAIRYFQNLLTIFLDASKD